MPELPVTTGHAPQCPVELAGFTMIINFTILTPDHPGLLPNAGGTIFGGLLFCLRGYHFAMTFFSMFNLFVIRKQCMIIKKPLDPNNNNN
jgi:hypothetical protein